MKTKSCVRDKKLAVTAVDGVAGKARPVAKIFAVGSTINTFAVSPAEPRNSDAITDFELRIADWRLRQSFRHDRQFGAPRSTAVSDPAIRHRRCEDRSGKPRTRSPERVVAPPWASDSATRAARVVAALSQGPSRAFRPTVTYVMPRPQGSARALHRRHLAWVHLRDACARCAETALYREHAPGTIRARDK